MNRTKILLNLARTPGELSGLRLMIGMANHALVVSEPIYRPEPYCPGEHFVMAQVDELPSVIARYLKDDEARERIVQSAYKLITTQQTLERSAQHILDLIKERVKTARSTP